MGADALELVAAELAAAGDAAAAGGAGAGAVGAGAGVVAAGADVAAGVAADIGYTDSTELGFDAS